MSLKDKIAIIGVGCTKFGENFELSYSDMVYEAAHEACVEAGIELKNINAAWLGTAFPDAGVWKGRSGMDLAEPLALFNIPVTRVSNYCATAGDALRNACMALLAGEHRIVLALGVEKLRDRSPRDSLVDYGGARASVLSERIYCGWDVCDLWDAPYAPVRGYS